MPAQQQPGRLGWSCKQSCHACLWCAAKPSISPAAQAAPSKEGNGQGTAGWAASKPASCQKVDSLSCSAACATACWHMRLGIAAGLHTHPARPAATTARPRDHRCHVGLPGRLPGSTPRLGGRHSHGGTGAHGSSSSSGLAQQQRTAARQPCSAEVAACRAAAQPGMS